MRTAQLHAATLARSPQRSLDGQTRRKEGRRTWQLQSGTANLTDFEGPPTLHLSCACAGISEEHQAGKMWRATGKEGEAGQSLGEFRSKSLCRAHVGVRREQGARSREQGGSRGKRAHHDAMVAQDPPRRAQLELLTEL